MNAPLLEQWQRLILPPAGVPVRAGEQLKTGNAYPNADNPDWPAHLSGRRTYAVNLAWTSPQGGALCKAAVLDIDEGPASLDKARALVAVARAGGLSCLPSWSGGKGCHVWLFFDPAPVPLAVAVLRKLKAAVPFDGDLIPGENVRAKLPPAFHQTAHLWAFWLDTLPDAPPTLANAPTGFLDAQAVMLATVTPSPIAALQRYACENTTQRKHNAPESMEPHLAKLAGELPPCIAALTERGAQTTLGTWDKNALTLARYCAAADVPQDAARTLLKTVSDHTGPDFETTKDAAARLKQWDSIHNPGPFGCGFLLTSRRALGFDCGQCAARPAGVRGGSQGSAAHGRAVADELLKGTGTPGDSGPDLDSLLADLSETERNRALSLRDALANIPPDARLGKHSAATTIGFGLNHEFDGRDVGAALCAEWDRRTGGKAAGVYAKADPDYVGKGQPVTADSIFKLARNSGWKPAKPETPANVAALRLEPTLADSLLALALQTGQPQERINPAIFPETPVPDTGKRASLHALAWVALVAGYSTPAAMLNWYDRQPEPPDPATQAALAVLVTRLEGLSLPDETETAALLERAVDLSARLALLGALADGRDETEKRQPLAGVLGSLQTMATRLQQETGATWGAPLTAYAAELLENLTQTDRPAIATPFETLNELLGGGLQGGKLYVLAAPPGGGKTTLSTQIADHAAGLGIPTCYCALEMGRGQLFDYALSRRLGMNSAKVESRSFRTSDRDRAALAVAAREYLETVAPFLAVIEGGWDTTAAALGAWVAQARARYALAPAEPVLVVVDYLQLLNTGDDKLDSGPNETPKVSTVAVQLKQLARDTGAAVLALSDIIKSEQGDAIKSGKEFTLNMLRGSNRVAHAADVVLAVYSEAAQGDGGKAVLDPWEMLAAKSQDNPKAAGFRRAMDDLAQAYPVGGAASAVHSRLELLKNRGGRGRGSQVLLYERAYHRFVGLSVPGQDETEGRGGDPAPSGGARGYSPAPDPGAAWKAAQARREQPNVDPETGLLDPDAPEPEWLRMKNDATRLKEVRRKGGKHGKPE